MRAMQAPSAARRSARGAAPLTFQFDPALPITARHPEILELLRVHPVLIVAGDTGSGKSTQLPQYCLELGRGIEGLIAHTQPRRIAARALAGRIAAELSQEPGGTVGFRVRFADRVSAATRLVLMTDGLLLTELSADPLLRRYDTIIVDEAHERTLNIDLLLGVLRGVLRRRPELKVIVTSATLEVERVARFFDDAPVLTVAGRGFPVEVRYRAAAPDGEEPDLPAAVLEACREIETEPGDVAMGDALVFLPGEREIRDVGELLERELRGVDIVPLHSRLAWEQQAGIFERGDRRRIVLATNVAETSITVPGIRAVIDSGLARVSRYSVRNRLQRLPIEPISRASAEQRKGRCGRLGPGLCLRLYTEVDYLERAPHTEPEILRTNLAALLLRLAADGLGAAEEFPFIDAPDGRALHDGYRLLQELGALDAARTITPRGRAMARLPLDPRLARALLESRRFHAEGELLALCAGLSVPDPRLARPGARLGAELEDPAEAAAFEDPRSEFSGLVRLWRGYRRAREGSRRELRRWCQGRQLSLQRLSEWDNVYAQIKDRAAELGIAAGSNAASYSAVHRALLAGFCTMVGVLAEEGVYQGPHGVRFHLMPGSSLKRRKPRWVMATHIVETSRVYARRVAEIQPQWIEAAAPHLVKREYLEPDWNEAREEVCARERVIFLGLILRADRLVNYGPIAPEAARLIFAREALVYRRLQRRPEWLRDNDAAIAAAQRVEDRLRTRDLLIAPEALVEFYAGLLPRQVSSSATLEHFTRHRSAALQAALQLTERDLYVREPDPAALAAFPDRVQFGTVTVSVDYRFAPGEPVDGANLCLPLLALPGLTRNEIDAAVPGFAVPRVEALLRSLPKEARRRLIPMAETAARFVAAHRTAPLDAEKLCTWLQQEFGVPPTLLRLDPAAAPAYLIPRLLVGDASGTIAHGTRLAPLRRETAARARRELEARAAAEHPQSWQRFELETLPATTALAVTDGEVIVYPGLTRDGDAVQLRFYWSAAEAEREHLEGVTVLARRVLSRVARDLAAIVAADAALMLAASPYLRGAQLIERLLQQTFRRACWPDGRGPRTRADFDAALAAARRRLDAVLADLIGRATTAFNEARATRRLIEGGTRAGLQALAEESVNHLRQLLDARARAWAAGEELEQLPRYVKAEARRWQRLASRGSEPAQIAAELALWTQRCRAIEAQLSSELRWLPQFDQLCRSVEEYRVSLYAQDLKTMRPVSSVRLTEQAVEIEDWLRR